MARELLVVDIEGVKVFERKMKELGRKGPEAIGQALYTVALAIFADSQLIVPVDTGTLKGSGGIEGPYKRDGGQEVLIYYGGAAANYAVTVHEDLEMYHEAPTQAKFLEVPYLMHLRDIDIEVANEMAGVITPMLVD